ncbi:hypothetical protein [Luteimonas granuli]|uniref:Uncharacterized protein n=1 Tax=Luteimonas granuli TaxID=1176533 RepID=A0A518N4M6_9GAMM|nr:hypothetical protein [Luteimonas granuli]QDW66866.1 hypothetical protein FPZ22_08135 [Luteimonas granuli]
MARLKALVSVGSAVAIGVVHGMLLSVAHAYLAVHFSVAAWIHSLGMGTVASNAMLFPIDLALNVLLSMPAVLVLRLLKPRHYAWYVLIALLAFLAWAYLPAAHLLGQIPLSWYTLWVLVMQVAPLPVAAWLVAWRRVPPNNSFKPTPLRGAA